MCPADETSSADRCIFCGMVQFNALVTYSIRQVRALVLLLIHYCTRYFALHYHFIDKQYRFDNFGIFYIWDPYFSPNECWVRLSNGASANTESNCSWYILVSLWHHFTTDHIFLPTFNDQGLSFNERHRFHSSDSNIDNESCIT